MINIFFLCHQILILFKVVEAVLWKLSLGYNLFSADSTLAEIVKLGPSTRLLWAGESQKHIDTCFHSKIWKSLDSTGERARNNLNIAVVCLLDDIQVGTGWNKGNIWPKTAHA